MARSPSSLAPTLLVSMPQMLDPNFARSVVLLCEHGPAGAFGLIVNRPSDTLAAAVGDTNPGDADLRVIAILRALKGGGELDDIETRRSPAPSKAKRLSVIEEERAERKRRKDNPAPLPAFVRREAVDVSSEDATGPLPASPKKPGKIACRLFAYLHQGYVLADREGLPGSGASVSRLIPLKPRFDRPENPRYLLDYEENYRQRLYDRDYGLELEWAGWITEIRGVGDSVYGLTPEGARVALEMFGPPEQPLSVLDTEGRKAADEVILRFKAGKLDEASFAAEVGIDVADVEDFVDQAEWYGDLDMDDDELDVEERCDPPPFR